MPIIPNTNGTETLKEVLLIFATPKFKVSVPYKINLSGFTKSPNNDLLSSTVYSCHTPTSTKRPYFSFYQLVCTMYGKFRV